jgi:butyryl-CoA dehydrogenase
VNFNLSEEQQMIMEMVKEYADGVLKPRAREVDESGEMPWDNIRQMAEMDLMGIPIPEEYGGAGLDFTTWAMVGEEISRACTTTGAVFGADMLCIYPIYFFGTEEQKKKYLVPLAKGEVVGAFGLTEPNAGSDAGNVRTRAVDAGDHYLLNGSKVFITNAGEADIYVIIANMDINKGARGLTAFIVEKGTPGFEIGKNEKKMAYSSLPNRELIFTDCKVPKENLLGKEKRGFRVALETLGVGRIGMGIGAVGLAQAALDEALEYSKVRVQFGKPISSFELIQAMPASYPHIGIPGFTRSVYNASHNGYFYRFRDTAKAILHLLGHAYNIYFTAATGWTGDYYGTTLAYAQRFQYLPGCFNLFFRLSRQ